MSYNTVVTNSLNVTSASPKMVPGKPGRPLSDLTWPEHFDIYVPNHPGKAWTFDRTYKLGRRTMCEPVVDKNTIMHDRAVGAEFQ